MSVERTKSEESFSLNGSDSPLDEFEELGGFNDTAFWGDNASGGAAAVSEGSESRSPPRHTTASRNEDNFLSNLLMDQTALIESRSVAMKSMAAMVRRASLRKKSPMMPQQSQMQDLPDLEGAASTAGSSDENTVREVLSAAALASATAAARENAMSPVALEMGVSMALGGTREWRQRKRMMHLVNGWLQSKIGGDNTSRVKFMKDILSANRTIATEFLADDDDHETSELIDGAAGLEGDDDLQGLNGIASEKEAPVSVTGYAYRMLQAVADLRQDATSDARAAQVFEILQAAAANADIWPDPLPAVVEAALDKVLCSSWRPPLSSFLALRFIIFASGSQSMRYCREVLTHSIHFQFRVVEAAMVTVAEEALEGTLDDPSSWVQPVISVIRQLSSTTMSAELLLLSSDVLSFTLSCKCAKTFVMAGGITALSEALLMLEASQENADLACRVLKLLNPHALRPSESDIINASPTSMTATVKDDNSARFQEAVASVSSSAPSRGFVAFSEDAPASDTTQRSGSTTEGRSTSRIISWLQVPSGSSHASTFSSWSLTDDHYHQIISAVTSVAHRFSTATTVTVTVESASPAKGTEGGSSSTPSTLPADVWGAIIEECSLILFASMQLAFSLCNDDGSVESLCRVIALSPRYWRSKVAMRAALSLIQSYLAVYHSVHNDGAGVSPGQNILTEARTGDVMINIHPPAAESYRLTTLSSTSSTNSPNYYRPIMQRGMLAVLSLALRSFALEDVGSNSLVASVYRTLHLVCLTEPAKDCFLRGCSDASLIDDDGDGDSNDDSVDAATASRLEPPQFNALIPCVVACLTRTAIPDHQRYCTMLLTRLCRGSPKEFGCQLLGPLPGGTFGSTAAAAAGGGGPGGKGHGAANAISVVATKEDGGPPSPVGAILRFYAKRLGTWHPSLIPVTLSLCREFCRIMHFPYASMVFQRGACEALFASIQSLVSSFSTDPNIVSSGCVALGHLCRCPHALSVASGVTATSADLRISWAASSQQSENLAAFGGSTSGATINDGALVSFAPFSGGGGAGGGRTRSVSLADSTFGASEVPPLLRYSVDHNVVDLAVTLSHGTFVDTSRSADNSKTVGGTPAAVDIEEHHLPSAPSTPPPSSDALLSPNIKVTGDGESPNVNLDPDAIVLRKRLPSIVKFGLAYLCASISLHSASVPTLREEGLVALMQSVVDVHDHQNVLRKERQSSDTNLVSMIRRATENAACGDSSPNAKPPATELGVAESSPDKKNTSAMSSQSTLLGRDEKLFLRQQLHIILATPEVDPAGSLGRPRSMRLGSISATGESLSSVIGNMFGKQQSIISSEAEERRMHELETELNLDALRSQFQSKRNEISTKEESKNVRLIRERSDMEGRYLEGRLQIESFQQDQFIEIVTYSQRALQKRLTAATTRLQQHQQSTSPVSSPLINTSSAATVAVPMERQSPVPQFHASGAASSQQQLMSGGELQALQQLEQLKLQLGIQATSTLGSVMEAVTATLAAVKQLQVQQERMSQELVAIPSPPPKSYYSGRERPLSAPLRGRSVGRSSHHPPPTQTLIKQPYHDVVQANDEPIYDDDALTEPSKPSPPMSRPMSANSHRPFVPPTRPSTCRPADTTCRGGSSPPPTFRLLFGRHGDTSRPFTPGHHAAMLKKNIAPYEIFCATPDMHLEDMRVAIESRCDLRVIDFNMAYLGDAGLLALLPALAQQISLEELHLKGNGLSAVSAVPLLAEVLAPQGTIRVLVLSNNPDLTPRFGRDLIAFVKHTTSLTRVALDGTQLFVSTKRIVESMLLPCQEDGTLEITADAASTPRTQQTLVQAPDVNDGLLLPVLTVCRPA